MQDSSATIESEHTDVQAPEHMTVLEALATDSFPTGPNMSNRSTPPGGDLDDQ